jgi:hypothetical protein
MVKEDGKEDDEGRRGEEEKREKERKRLLLWLLMGSREPSSELYMRLPHNLRQPWQLILLITANGII